MSSLKTEAMLSRASRPWRSQRPRVRLMREKVSPRLMKSCARVSGSRDSLAAWTAKALMLSQRIFAPKSCCAASQDRPDRCSSVRRCLILLNRRYRKLKQNRICSRIKRLKSQEFIIKIIE